jgi:rod shape determining protein RodA
MLSNQIKKFDWLLISSAIFLTGIGLLSLYSSSQTSGDFLNFKKQAIFWTISFLAMVFFSFFDYRALKENSYLILFLYLLSIIFLAGLFLFAPGIRGVRGWYKIGPISLDPAEFTKIILVILLAKYFSFRHAEMYKLRHIILSGVYVAIPAMLVYFQPDLGSALIFICLWFGILIVSGIKLRHFLILVLLAIIMGILAWSFMLKDYQKERIISFLFPEYEPLETGWNQKQAKIAIGSGGLFGKGLGKGSQTQYGFLPEPQTDFIFAAVGEEFGLITLTGMLLLFLILFWRITKIALFARDNFSRLFSLGLGIWLVIQLFINIGSNIGFLPIIGVPLPLVSYGGSSLLAIYIGLGILQNIKINSFRAQSL